MAHITHYFLLPYFRYCVFLAVPYLLKKYLTRRMLYTSRLGQNCSVVENITIKRVRLPQGHLKLHRSNETIQA